MTGKTVEKNCPVRTANRS